MIFTHLLFPTPVFTSYYKCEENMVAFLNSIEYRKTKTEYITNFGESSKETYILNDKKCEHFKKYITEISTDIMKNALSIDTKTAKITQSWISTKCKGQSHGIHNHPNSILSGVYYFDNYDNTTEPIIFHKNVITNTYELQIDTIPNNNPISSDSFSITPTNGLIVLFPSYVKHSVNVNNNETPRKCLAFNLIPEEGFGCRGGFSELYFNS